MDVKQRIENKQLDKDKPLAFQQFSYFLETRNDPDYPKMYKKINLWEVTFYPAYDAPPERYVYSVIVDNLSCVINEISF